MEVVNTQQVITNAKQFEHRLAICLRLATEISSRHFERTTCFRVEKEWLILLHPAIKCYFDQDIQRKKIKGKKTYTFLQVLLHFIPSCT